MMDEVKKSIHGVIELELNDLSVFNDTSMGYNHRRNEELGGIFYDKWTVENGCNERGACFLPFGEWTFINVRNTVCSGSQVKMAVPIVNGARRLCVPFTGDKSDDELAAIISSEL